MPVAMSHTPFEIPSEFSPECAQDWYQFADQAYYYNQMLAALDGMRANIVAAEEAWRNCEGMTV